MTREEAIKELEILKEDYWDDDGYGHETKQYDDTMLALNMAIEALKSRPKGKWITTNGYFGIIYTCSQCDNREAEVRYINFCPKCGADMRGE